MKYKYVNAVKNYIKMWILGILNIELI